MHVERTFTVAQPVETVFDYLADFTHTNEWDPGTVETTRTSGDGGVGTTYANTSEFMGAGPTSSTRRWSTSARLGCGSRAGTSRPPPPTR